MNHDENDVREQLGVWLALDEPPMTATAADVRRRGRSMKRRRFGAGVATCAMVAVASIAITTAVVNGSDGAPNGPEAGPASDDAATPARVAPESYASTLERLAGGSVAFDAAPAVEAFDGQEQALSGADRSNASRWQGQFVVADGHVMDINTLYVDESAGQVPAEALKAQCAFDVSNGQADTCDVNVLDGVTTQYLVRQGIPVGGGWVKVTPEALGALGKETWYIQQATVRYRSGFTSVVTEAVRRENLADARVSFNNSPDQLFKLAGDPTLTFSEPPRNDAGCAWTKKSGISRAACNP